MKTPAVVVEGLVVRVGGRALLEVPQLELAAGERVAIVGANGAGKSTLLRVLGGFVPAAAGHVQVLGRTLGPAPGAAALRALRAEVGQVHQGLHLVPRLTARENVLIGALARVPGWRSWARLYPAPLQAEADAALAAFGLAARAHERADRLSGGERQKLGLARLLLQRPRLILADEPTAALDPSAAAEACETLCRAAAGATLVTVVHQPALLPRLAERVLGLAGGRIVFDLPVGHVGPEVLDRLYGGAVSEPVPPDPPEENRMSVTRSVAAAVGAFTLAGCAALGPQDRGLVALKSPHGAAETMNRFEAQAKQRGLAVAARVDHAAGAARIGRTLRPTELLIFGNPQAGTPLMECAQGVGIDLPMKALVWVDAQGQVWLGYNDPAWIVRRHGAPDCAAAANVAKALAGIAAAAVAP